MTVYRPTRKDAETLSLAGLHGQRIDAVDAPDAGGTMVQAGGLWRVVAHGHVAIPGDDHRQPFGLGAPVDAAQRMLEAIAEGAVVDAGFDAITGDLRVELEGGARLEVSTSSCGYESWSVRRPDGIWLIGGGGGEVTPTAPDRSSDLAS